MSSPPADALRVAYQRACDPEYFIPDGPLVDSLHAEFARPGPGQGAESADEPWSPAGSRQQVSAWSAARAARYLALAEQTAPDAVPSLVRRAALGCMPLGLVQGAWLQWLSSPGRADDPVSLRLLALYASDIGVGRPHDSRGSAYLAMLRTLRQAEYAVPTAAVALDDRIGEPAFHLPAVLMTASRRPEAFRAELIGADLCVRAVGLLPALTLIRHHHPDCAAWTALDGSSARQEGEPAAVQRSLAVVEELIAGRPAMAAGARQGFRWAFEVLSAWDDNLFAELAAARDPTYEMAELLRARSAEAVIYHHDYLLSGRPLTQWLAESRTDPHPLLTALAGSRLVRPGDADRSPLLNGLIGERGPMFRIFSPPDLTVLRNWINSLPAGGGAATGPGPAGRSHPPTLPAPAEPLPGPGPADLREAFHRLLHRTGDPGTHRFARGYVQGWLARSAHRMGDGDSPLPARWPEEGLRGWLGEQHDRHARSFDQTSDDPLPSRAEVVESTVQLAPLTLIDGSWLHGFTDAGLASSPVGFALFDTYWDELGNGVPTLNHPIIYREVLAEMDATPPATASIEFARWPRFLDRSFELPVYWLSIGRFPRTFLAEVLGLNLAMELSGVGGSYRRARIALRAHGFSTRFVDIHNTIDNVATGHSAWAAKAIDTYLSTLPALTGGERDEVWRRVRIGFRSLNPPDGRAARRAERHARKLSELG
ncbi:iron-containing redox enzyme family protein [Actinoplanes sp. NPDC051470]|uniref:iron-containing redox enzyme family protein n=1 Tax=Actinoplanes sp. NPDC051470 TaxID=3157224 RepID=UPI003421F6BD